MFGNLFGWRKASKCKKLVKAVKCRLKMLRNKKCCMVNQLKRDVAELLKYGLDQIALQRVYQAGNEIVRCLKVEQLIKYETTVEVYDLLDQFCEHIIANLHYIQKHKECPKEIIEAASTLIFSSARLGELPELLSIRKLFEERYGQRFMMLARELLPGNVVNRQMIEKVETKDVPDDEKNRVLDEIASSCIHSGQYLLEYRPEFHEDKAIKGSSIPASSGEVQVSNEGSGRQLRLWEGNKKSCKESSFALRKERVFPDGLRDSDPGEIEKTHKACNEMNKHTLAMKSSSEASARPPEETIYPDDTEEHTSPVCKVESPQDQRLLMIKSFGMPLNQNINCGMDIYVKEQNVFLEKLVLMRSSRKTRRARRKRSRRRSISPESRSVTDTEGASYYGDSEDTATDNKCKSNFHHRRKILVQGSPNSYGTKVRNSFKDRNLERNYRWDNQDESDAQMTLLDVNIHGPKEGNIQCELQICKYNPRGKDEHGGTGEVPERAMSMPAERHKEDATDNMSRSISFPLEQPRSKYSSFHHIHPKLPDYDELAAKFVALRTSKLQNMH